MFQVLKAFFFIILIYEVHNQLHPNITHNLAAVKISFIYYVYFCVFISLYNG